MLIARDVVRLLVIMLWLADILGIVFWVELMPGRRLWEAEMFGIMLCDGVMVGIIEGIIEGIMAGIMLGIMLGTGLMFGAAMETVIVES